MTPNGVDFSFLSSFLSETEVYHTPTGRHSLVNLMQHTLLQGSLNPAQGSLCSCRNAVALLC